MTDTTRNTQRATVDARITSNVRSMIDQGADETEIDDYIHSEGMTVEAFKSGQPLTVMVDGQPDSDRSVVDLARQEMIDAGMPTEEIQKFSKEQGLPEYRPEGASFTDNVQGVAASLLDGAIPYVSDNVAGVGGTVNNAWRSALGWEPFDPSAGFESGKIKFQGARDRFEEEHPIVDGIGQTAGFLGSLALPITKFGQAGKVAQASTKNAAINGAATGGIYGTVGGALNDTGAGRAENALWGGVGGAALGTIGAPIAQGVTSAASWGRRTLPGANTAMSSIENQIARLRGIAPPTLAPVAQGQRLIHGDMENNTIATGMGQGDVPMTPESISQEIANRNAMGVPAMPADLGEQNRRLLSWALQGRGPMTTRARQALSARQSTQGNRVRQHVQDELGEAVDPIKAVSDIQKRAAKDAAPNYRQAYNEGIVVTPEIQEAMRTPAFQQGLRQAHTNILNRGGNPSELGIIQDAAGNLSLGKAPTMEAFDHVVRTMKQDIPRNPMTGAPLLDSNTGALSDAANKLDGLLRDQNKFYDATKRQFADEMALKDAIDRGGKVGNLSGHEINAQIRSMPDNAQEAWMTGARTALADRAVVAGQQPTANVAADIQRQVGLPGAGLSASHGDRVKLDALDNLARRLGSMGRLASRLEGEDQAYKTYQELSKGPQPVTAAQLLSNGLEVAQSLGNLAHGNIPAALAPFLPRGGIGSFGKEARDHVAGVMAETDPIKVRAAMEAIERTIAKDARHNKAVNAAGIQLGRTAATAFGGSDGDAYHHSTRY